jgi:hypothetical protein
MDIVHRNLVGTDCLCYIDDIMFSNTEEHAAKLEKVLERCDKASLQLHPGKCSIAQPKVNY